MYYTPGIRKGKWKGNVLHTWDTKNVKSNVFHTWNKKRER